MASKETTTILFKSELGSTEATLYYTAFTSNDRRKRAIIMWVGCWILAIASIPIILAHFVLVPAFLIAGPWFGISRYQQAMAKEKAVGICPKHQQETTIKLETDDQLPKWAYCPECNQSLELIEQPAT